MDNQKQDKPVLKGGVITMGSLYWEKSQIRKKWRTECLGITEQHIALPIRYGRISSTRSCTFTMVFSSECISSDKMGKGIFLNFNKDIQEFSDLTGQTRNLINAEHNDTVGFTRFNWSWGCLAIIFNPAILEGATPKHKLAKSILQSWSSKFGETFKPEEYKAGEETPVVSKKGLLLIDWPEMPEGIDFAIATAIKPEQKNGYPSVKNIAERMVVNDYDMYFKSNRKSGIVTFQDNEIEENLANIKKA